MPNECFIPAILYLFCDYPHICQYISYLEIRTGEYPPNFRLLSTSSSFFILTVRSKKALALFILHIQFSNYSLLFRKRHYNNII